MRYRLLLGLVSLGLFFSFILFSYLVHKDIFLQFDFDTTVKVQDNLSHHWDFPFSVLSLLGLAEVTCITWLLILIFSLWKKAWLTALSLLSFWFGTIIELFGKLSVIHPGPPFLFYRGVIDIDLPSHYVNTGNAYPSGHMFRSVFLAIFIGAYLLQRKGHLPKLVLIPAIVLFILAMGVSRVYLGEHWTTDVIGGALLGTSMALLSAATLPLKRQDIN